jgi:SAM-dependent methyltransferase
VFCGASVLSDNFWTAYTLRQPRTDAAEELRATLKPWLANIRSVLEVGCNRGDNLAAFNGEWPPTGVEPNKTARALALEAGYRVYEDKAEHLRFLRNSYDLVFTVGVLIHLDDSKLDKALKEIHRVSRRYILAVEYKADTPTPVDYRGVRAGIWKRNYGFEYLARFPDLELLEYGDAGAAFDDCTYWMFEKLR